MTYGIWTTIDSGVTGSRSAWLKSDGKPVTFATEAEAETYATALTNRNTLKFGLMLDAVEIYCTDPTEDEYAEIDRAFAARCLALATVNVEG